MITMKTLPLLVLLLLSSFLVFGQTTSFTTTFKFIGIEKGYDHICKTQVWIDGTLVGESAEVSESKGGSVTVDLPIGEHRIRIINLVKYEGRWEEHTLQNLYSIDCLWEGTHSFYHKNENIYLLFNIDDETKVSWDKMPKK